MHAYFHKLNSRAGRHLAVVALLIAGCGPGALARTPHGSHGRPSAQRAKILRAGGRKQVGSDDHRIPKLDYRVSCRTALAVGQLMSGSNGRTDNACDNDEKAAHVTLKKEWSQFSAAQKSMCFGLEQAGGSPSYVELLTCLELGQAVAQLPKQAINPNGQLPDRTPSKR